MLDSVYLFYFVRQGLERSKFGWFLLVDCKSFEVHQQPMTSLRLEFVIASYYIDGHIFGEALKK